MIVFFLCFLGCLYQVSHVSSQYFSYKTTTRVQSELENVVRYPDLNLCAEISDFVSKTDLKRHNLSSKYQLVTLNLKQLYDLTPATNESIEKCFLRIDRYNQYKMYSSDVCYKNILVRKYVVSNTVCYQFHPDKRLNYSITEVANAFNYSSYVYEIHLSQAFNESTELYFVAQYPSFTGDAEKIVGFPVYSRKYGEILTRYKYENWLVFRPSEEYYTLLPYPYDTDCTNDNLYCIRYCVISESTSRMGRFPFTEPFNGSLQYSNLKPLTTAVLHDYDAALIWKDIQESCHKNCSKVLCETSITTTDSVYVYKHYMKTYLSLLVSVPTSYTKKIYSIPVMNWIDYLSGICNSISIWFGISVLAFVSLVRRLTKRKRVTMQRDTKQYALIAYHSICLIGFLYQCFQLCNDFFQYKTSSIVEVVADDVYMNQRIVICLGFREAMNSRTLTNYSELTVKQLIQLAPNPKEFVLSCGLRDHSNYGLIEQSVNSCFNHFSIETTIKGHRFCYIIVPKKHTKYSWRKVATSYKNQGQVYDMKFGGNFSNTLIATIVSFVTRRELSIPGLSRNFAQRVLIDSDNVIAITSLHNTYSTLPPPYDTMCEANPMNGCMFKCLNLSYSKINRVSYSLYIYDLYDTKIVNQQDLANLSVAEIIFDGYKNCEKECRENPCHQSVCFTLTKTFYDSKEIGRIRIISTVPTAPTFNIYTVASVDFLNFFLNICNCFGIWFGLSMLSFNPSDLLKNKVLKKHRIRNHHSIPTTAKKMKQKLLTYGFLSGCILGFIWQEYLVSNAYFKFKTYNRMEISVTDVRRFPHIAVCMPYRDLMKEDTFNLTVRQLLNMTPDTNTTLIKCCLRNDETSNMRWKNGSDCRNIWNTVKYITGENVCYSMISPLNKTYSMEGVTSAMTHTGIIFKLYLNRTLAVTSDLLFIAYSYEAVVRSTQFLGQPIRGRYYLEKVLRDTSVKDPLNYFVVQATLRNVSLLPKPYDTMCVENEVHSFCEAMCITNYTKTILNRVPFQEMISQPLDFKMMSETDLHNDTFKKLLKIGYEICKYQCATKACRPFYTMTSVDAYSKPHVGYNHLIVAAGVPKSNELIVKTYPSITLFDYLNNLAVSGSIWLGVSVLSIIMYPIRLVKKYVGTKADRFQNRVEGNDRLKRFHDSFNITSRHNCSCSYCRTHFSHRKKGWILVRSSHATT